MDANEQQAGGPDDGGSIVEHQLVDEAVAPATTSSSGRWWLAVAAIVVVGAFGAAVVVATRDESSTASASAPRLGLAPAEAWSDFGVPVGAGASHWGVLGELPDAGQSAAVYRVTPMEVTDERANELAALLGLESALTRSDEGWYGSGGGHSLALSVGESVSNVPSLAFGVDGGRGMIIEYGGTSMNTTVTVGSEDGSTGSSTIEPVPDPAAAESIARNLLQSMGVLDGSWDFEVTDGGIYDASVACDPGSPCTASGPMMTSRNVMARLVVGGVPTDAVTWRVEIGTGGSIEGVYGSLVEVVLLGEYPLQSTREALDRTFDGTAIGIGSFGGMENWLDEPLLPTVGSEISGPDSPGAGDEQTYLTTSDGSVVPPAPPVEVIDGVRVRWTQITGSVDGVKSQLLVPTYEFIATTEPTETRSGYESGFIVVALSPEAFESLDPGMPGYPEEKFQTLASSISGD